jgi:hypothetical protein
MEITKMQKVLIIGYGKLAKHLEKKFMESNIKVDILCRFPEKELQGNFCPYNLEAISFTNWKNNSIDFKNFNDYENNSFNSSRSSIFYGKYIFPE